MPWVLLLGAILVSVDLCLGPVQPLALETPRGGGCSRGVGDPHGGSEHPSMLALVPAGAPLIASNDLNTRISNDATAYGRSYCSSSEFLYVPFNGTDPPWFVLLSEVELTDLPFRLTTLLSNTSVFGLRATDAGSPAGFVLV